MLDSSSSDLPDPLVGKYIGNYILKHLLGTGGSAKVYLAENNTVRRHKAAIKLWNAKFQNFNEAEYWQAFSIHEKALAWFAEEAERIASLRSSSTIELWDYGHEGINDWFPDVEKGDTDLYLPYIIMPYFPKNSLKKHYPKGKKLPLRTVVRYVRDVADSLQVAHNQNIIHRDVNPANMLLGPKGEVMICDLGIAQRVHDTTSSGGTPEYTPWEQWQGKAVPASDQYALAITVYEWLTGRRPFEGKNLQDIIEQHRQDIPTLPRIYNRAIPPAVEEVILKALAKDPKQRHETISKFAYELEKAARTHSPERRNMLKGLATAAGILVLIGVVKEGALLFGGSGPHGPSPVGTAEAKATPTAQPTAMKASAPSDPRRMTSYTYGEKVRVVRYSPDGTHIASAGDDNIVTVRNALSGGVITTYPGHDGAIRALAWSGDGTRISSASHDTVQFWDARTGIHMSTYQANMETVRALAWSPDGTHVCWAGENGAWVEDDPSRCEASCFDSTFTEHNDIVTSAAWEPDSQRIATGGYDWTIRLWNKQNGEQLHAFTGHKNIVTSVDLSPDGFLLASGSKDGTVRLWNVLDGSQRLIIDPKSTGINAVAFSPNVRYIAFGADDGTVQVWDVHSNICMYSYSGHTAPVNSIDWADGTRLISAGDDHLVIEWAAEPFEQRNNPQPHHPTQQGSLLKRTLVLALRPFRLF